MRRRPVLPEVLLVVHDVTDLGPDEVEELRDKRTGKLCGMIRAGSVAAGLALSSCQQSSPPPMPLVGYIPPPEASQK